jgi:hypothetical protein
VTKSTPSTVGGVCSEIRKEADSREHLLADETYVCTETAIFMAGMLSVYYVYAKKMA